MKNETYFRIQPVSGPSPIRGNDSVTPYWGKLTLLWEWVLSSWDIFICLYHSSLLYLTLKRSWHTCHFWMAPTFRGLVVGH